MLAKPPFAVQMVLSGWGTQVIVRGELDVTAAADLGQALASLRDGADGGGLVLHMGEVEFIDCACARVIAQAARTWPGSGPAVIRDPSPIVRRVFQLTGLARGAEAGSLSLTTSPGASTLGPGQRTSPARCWPTAGARHSRGSGG